MAMLQPVDGQKGIEVTRIFWSQEMIKVFKWPGYSNGHHKFYEKTSVPLIHIIQRKFTIWI